jgi:polyphosphate kinase 2 (PPK2 family)
MALFDRSWYNRAVVEPVMGFCTRRQQEHFLAEVPGFEAMLRRDGIILFKFWLTIGREMQMKRFHARRHDPLKRWKLSPVDLKSVGLWDEYSLAIEQMMRATHFPDYPWTIIRANDKRRARLAIIRKVLHVLDYAEKDVQAAGAPDPLIAGDSPEFIQGV